MQRLSLAAVLAMGAALAASIAGCDSPQASTLATPSAETQSAAPQSNATASSVDETVEQAAAASADKPRPPLKPGARTRVLSAAGDRAFDKTFDDLRFEMQVGEPFRREMLTEGVTALDGQHVRIRGFMLPTAQKRGLKQFVLVRDNQECCFGPGAALFDCILIKMEAGKTAEFSIRPIAVEGTFNIREFVGPNGVHLAIYQIDATAAD